MGMTSKVFRRGLCRTLGKKQVLCLAFQPCTSTCEIKFLKLFYSIYKVLRKVEVFSLATERLNSFHHVNNMNYIVECPS